MVVPTIWHKTIMYLQAGCQQCWCRLHQKHESDQGDTVSYGCDWWFKGFGIQKIDFVTGTSAAGACLGDGGSLVDNVHFGVCLELLGFLVHR